MSSAPIRFSSIYKTPGYLDATYRILRERPKSMNISHKRMPSHAEHRKFVRSKPYKEWNFIRIGRDTVGTIYLTPLNEIGFFLFREFHGKGLELPILKAFLAKRRHLRLLVNLSLQNTQYAEWFQKLGFTWIQKTYCLEP